MLPPISPFYPLPLLNLARFAPKASFCSVSEAPCSAGALQVKGDNARLRRKQGRKTFHLKMQVKLRKLLEEKGNFVVAFCDDCRWPAGFLSLHSVCRQETKVVSELLTIPSLD